MSVLEKVLLAISIVLFLVVLGQWYLIYRQMTKDHNAHIEKDKAHKDEVERYFNALLEKEFYAKSVKRDTMAQDVLNTLERITPTVDVDAQQYGYDKIEK